LIADLSSVEGLKRLQAGRRGGFTHILVFISLCPQDEEVVLTAESNISGLTELSFTGGKGKQGGSCVLWLLAFTIDWLGYLSQVTALSLPPSPAKAVLVLMSYFWSNR
jgi:hypothetical protein